MPVSKNRKNHKNKVKQRKQRIANAKKRQEAIINSYLSAMMAEQAKGGLKPLPMTADDVIAEGGSVPQEETDVVDVEFKEE